MAINKYYGQFKVQQDAVFQAMVRGAILYSADYILIEPSTVEGHAARLKMANELLGSASLVREEFFRRLITEVSMQPDVQAAAVHNGNVYADIVSEDLYNGKVSALWNKVMFAVWPDIETA